MVYSCQDPEAESTPPLARLLIGVIEDARVETLAVRTFPGLGLLWKSLLHVDPGRDDGLGPCSTAWPLPWPMTNTRTITRGACRA
jgi:hypothetical protein